MTLNKTLQAATQALSASSESPRLDAEILLAHLLKTSRAYLLAHADQVLQPAEQTQYQALINRRKQQEPIAYLCGHKEFWSLDLLVTPDTLIPRPETELLVELTLSLLPSDQTPIRVADLGTGSGAIALALARERPYWEIHALDYSSAALTIASQNATRLGLDKIHFHQGSWCKGLPKLRFDALVSNPPYLSENEWQTCPKDLHFEPNSALVSGPEGLDALEELITSAKPYLKDQGWLLLEHGNLQAKKVRALLQAAGFAQIKTQIDLAGNERVSLGRFSA